MTIILTTKVASKLTETMALGIRNAVNRAKINILKPLYR